MSNEPIQRYSALDIADRFSRFIGENDTYALHDDHLALVTKLTEEVEKLVAELTDGDDKLTIAAERLGFALAKKRIAELEKFIAEFTKPLVTVDEPLTFELYDRCQYCGMTGYKKRSDGARCRYCDPKMGEGA